MGYDDENPSATNDSVPEPKTRSVISGKTKITAVHKKEVPLEATNLTVLLELEGSNGSEEDKPGVDIVAVLDVSRSMNDDNKLDKIKRAAKFLINILTKNHRLSVVSFSTEADVRCPLRCMTEDAKDEIGGLVDCLEAGGTTNIAAGLKSALKVLEERKYSRGRVAAIMLVSDGDQVSRFDKAAKVPVDKVSVFTFGIGNGEAYDPEVLNTIANNSKGGTFSIVAVQNKESDNLSIAFALCLGWLLSVVVQDFQMTITTAQLGIKINSVLPTYYQISKDDDNATIPLGHLCNREKRSFLVELQLPIVAYEGEYKVLEITYSHIYDGEPFDSKPKMVTVSRISEPLDEEKIETEIEKKRIEALDKMKKAIDLANECNFDGAKSELQQARDSLDTLNYPIIEALKSQLEQLIELMNSDLYENKGHHIALSILTSHCRQREAITNDDLEKSNLFATDAMCRFTEKVKPIIEDAYNKPSERISELLEHFQALLEAPKTNE